MAKLIGMEYSYSLIKFTTEVIKCNSRDDKNKYENSFPIKFIGRQQVFNI